MTEVKQSEDALYIRLRSDEVDHTKEAYELILFDFNDHGDLIGIEILLPRAQEGSEEDEPKSFEWLYTEAKRTKDVKGMLAVAQVGGLTDRYREIYDTAVAWEDWATAAWALALDEIELFGHE